MSLCHTSLNSQHVLQVQAATASLEPDQTVGMSEQEVLERRWENAKAILQAYRFTGTGISDLG